MVDRFADVLDEVQVAFMLGPVSVSVAGRDAANVPTLSRTVGCRVSADHRRVTVFVSASRSASLLDDLRSNGAVAAVFSRPSTHETIQLKGEDARVEPLAQGDTALLAAAVDVFAQELVSIGFPEHYARAVHGGALEDYVAVSFTPAAAFVQTPGPAAGQRIDARS
jgi:hypothetical protein